MIDNINVKRCFEYENGFYLTAQTQRLAKFAAQYELFKLSVDIPGDIVEFGVFKGASFCRLAAYREMLGCTSKGLVGFDTFDTFPCLEDSPEYHDVLQFTKQAGKYCISEQELKIMLAAKQCGNNVRLIAGDILKTVPEFAGENKDRKISFINLDTDTYDPAVTILSYIYPQLSKGGVLVLDDYNKFPGETRAVDEYFENRDEKVRKSPIDPSIHYIIKP